MQGFKEAWKIRPIGEMSALSQVRHLGKGRSVGEISGRSQKVGTGSIRNNLARDAG
jgi:hypothetical protein